MGTNYYAVTEICPHCGRFDKEIHIGKYSAGWTFSFHGYRDYCAPFEDLKIETYSQWLDFLTQPSVQIRDEYGTNLALESLKDLIERKRVNTLNHTIESRKDYPAYAKDFCWLDPEGHSFSSRDWT